MKNVNVKKVVEYLADILGKEINKRDSIVGELTDYPDGFVLEFVGGKGKKFKVTVEEIKGKTSWTKAKDVKKGMEVFLDGTLCKILSTKSSHGDEVVVVEFLDGTVTTANVSDLEKA